MILELPINMGQWIGEDYARDPGGLKHLHKETVRIQKLIDKEFEQIDAEDRE